MHTYVHSTAEQCIRHAIQCCPPSRIYVMFMCMYVIAYESAQTDRYTDAEHAHKYS